MSFCIIFVCFIVHFIVHAAFVRMKLMTTTMVIAARQRVTAGQTDRRHAALEIDLFLLGFISAPLYTVAYWFLLLCIQCVTLCQARRCVIIVPVLLLLDICIHRRTYLTAVCCL